MSAPPARPIWQDVPTRYRRLVKIAAISVGVYFLFGAFSFLIPKLAFPFLPSEEWIDESRLFSTASAVFSCAIGTLAVLAGMRSKGEDTFTFKSFLTIGFGWLMFWTLGLDAVRLGYPMLSTAWAGRHVSLDYTVEKASGWSDSKCRQKIELRNMPFMIDELCGFPEIFRKTLAPGSRIEVRGYGTEKGVFVSSARKK